MVMVFMSKTDRGGGFLVLLILVDAARSVCAGESACVLVRVSACAMRCDAMRCNAMRGDKQKSVRMWNVQVSERARKEARAKARGSNVEKGQAQFLVLLLSL